MILVRVDNRIRVHCKRRSPLGLDLEAAFTHDNPAYRTWKTFRKGAPPPKLLVTHESEGRGTAISVPRGGFETVMRLVAQHGETAEVEDNTVDEDHIDLDPPEVPLWPHQQRLVESFQTGGRFGGGFRNGLWRAPQGAGKTQAVLTLACLLGSRALIVVSSSSLFDQWCIRIRRELGIEPGEIRGGKRVVREITIGMAQTLTKCASDYADTFGFVCLDESQLFPSETMQNVVGPLRARYRLGVSGDERRADGKECLTYDTFGPVTCEVEQRQIEKSGEIVEVEIRIVPTDFRADWYVALGADGPSDERQRVLAARAKVDARAQLLEQLTQDEARNLLIVETSLGVSREAKGLAEPSQFLILSDRREHCHRLDALLAARSIPAGLFIGGQDYARQFQLTLAGMKNGSLAAAVGTYQAIGVGFEAHRELSLGFCASPCVFNPKSRMQFNQYRGRFARSAPGKQRGVLFYFWDRHVYGINPVRLLCRWNKTVKVQTSNGWVDGKQFLKDA